MKPYEYLEDEATADVAFIAHGKSLEEAFSNCAQAMLDLMTNTGKVKVQEIKKVVKTARDLKALLYDFLEEIVYYNDAENIVFKTARVDEVREEDGKYFLSAVLEGEVFDAGRHESGSHVKAITYFGMEVKQEGKEWLVKVTIDL